jgi:HAD superfamily hydrolase (TIGR01509 family)
MLRLKALLWDVDGTLAETERDGHLLAFNMAFDACGLPWRWSESAYGDLLRITGGRERLMFDMSQRADAPPLTERDAVTRAIHTKKNALYAALVRSHAIALRGGVQTLMQQCRERGVRMGITTTTSRSNVDALLSVNLGQRWAEGFAVIVCGEDVQHKKPDPEVYVKALRALDIDPLEAVAIEDSPGGVLAARAASIPVVVTRSAFFAETPIEGAIAIGPGLHDRRGWLPALPATSDPAQCVDLDDIERWCAQMARTAPGPLPRQAALG